MGGRLIGHGIERLLTGQASVRRKAGARGEVSRRRKGMPWRCVGGDGGEPLLGTGKSARELLIGNNTLMDGECA